jgi:hypothetical protein
MNEPVLAVCIPTFEEESYITKCLEALSHQTMFSMSEIIIADYDPHNTRKTFDAVGKWAHQRKGRIKYVPVKEKGIGLARNTAVRNCGAPIVTTFDADAYFGQKDALERLVNPLMSGFFWTACDNYLDDQSNDLANTMYNFGNLLSSLGVVGYEQGLTFTRDAFEMVGGYANTQIAEGRTLDVKLTLFYGIKRRMHVKDIYVVSSARRVKNMDLFNMKDALDYWRAFRGEKVLSVS